MNKEQALNKLNEWLFECGDVDVKVFNKLSKAMFGDKHSFDERIVMFNKLTDWNLVKDGDFLKQEVVW